MKAAINIYTTFIFMYIYKNFYEFLKIRIINISKNIKGNLISKALKAGNQQKTFNIKIFQMIFRFHSKQ